MTTKVGDVRTAAAEAITTATGLRAYGLLQDKINAPCAMVGALEFDPRYVLGSTVAEYPFQVRCFFNRAADQANQELIDTYRDVTGELSLTAALIDGDNWPDALVQSVDVTRVGELQVVEYIGVGYLYFEVDFSVIW